MDFFFPEDGLERVEPEQTHITALTAEPYPDGNRVRIGLEITPFLKRPYIEMLITDAQGDEVATASIVEPMGWKLEITMHLRGAKPGPFQVQAKLFYPDGPQAEPMTLGFEVKTAE